MDLDFLDILLNILMYIAIILVVIGTVFKNFFNVFTLDYFFTNKKDRKSFNGALKNSWTISTLCLVLAMVITILASVIHLVFRT